MSITLNVYSRRPPWAREALAEAFRNPELPPALQWELRFLSLYRYESRRPRFDLLAAQQRLILLNLSLIRSDD